MFRRPSIDTNCSHHALSQLVSFANGTGLGAQMSRVDGSLYIDAGEDTASFGLYCPGDSLTSPEALGRERYHRIDKFLIKVTRHILGTISKSVPNCRSVGQSEKLSAQKIRKRIYEAVRKIRSNDGLD
jgi:hypothetical protein